MRLTIYITKEKGLFLIRVVEISGSHMKKKWGINGNYDYNNDEKNQNIVYNIRIYTISAWFGI